MEYRYLGRSGLRVSEIAVGNWLTQGRTIGDDVTDAIVKTAFDAGVNFFDTADVYHSGAAEIALGKAIKGIRREDVVIATKCFFPASNGPNDRGLSHKHICESVNASLSRLGINEIDLMQFHRFDPSVPLQETVRAIDTLIRQGKVYYWGVSQWPAVRIKEVTMIARELNCAPPISNQPLYNMLQTGIEAEILPVSVEVGVGQVVYSPLAQGVLTGKYLPGKEFPQGSRGADATSNEFMGRYLTTEVLERVQKLKAFAADLGHDLAPFALGWCLRKSGVASVIVGASSKNQVLQNLKGADVKLSDEHWAQAEAILVQQNQG